MTQQVVHRTPTFNPRQQHSKMIFAETTETTSLKKIQFFVSINSKVIYDIEKSKWR